MGQLMTRSNVPAVDSSLLLPVSVLSFCDVTCSSFQEVPAGKVPSSSADAEPAASCSASASGEAPAQPDQVQTLCQLPALPPCPAQSMSCCQDIICQRAQVMRMGGLHALQNVLVLPIDDMRAWLRFR